MRPYKFGALVLAYNQEDYISYCLRSVSPHVDQIVTLFSTEPWTAYNPSARNQFLEPDRTGDILGQLRSQLDNLTVISGSWSGEEEMRNHGLAVLRDAGLDICLIVDADEVHPQGGLEKLKATVAEHDAPGTAYYLRSEILFRRFDYAVESHYRRADGSTSPERCAVAIHLDARSLFANRRHPTANIVELPETYFFWHFGYVLSDERMWEKLHTFAHAHEIVPRWFEEKWLGWTPETRDLFYKEPRSRWARTNRIDKSLLPDVMREHPFFSRNGK